MLTLYITAEVNGQPVELPELHRQEFKTDMLLVQRIQELENEIEEAFDAQKKQMHHSSVMAIYEAGFARR